jgi:DNA-binding transcriptional MerR regulator/methylmalonyl-CoA mutase cobalamin-binding subunit
MTAISNTYEKPSHPIKVVATRTGLSKDVIRVWEKRYQAISPERSDTGRRLYADADIDHLLKLKQAIAAGWRISDVAKLSEAELDELVAGKPQPADAAGSGPARGEFDTGSSYLLRCLDAIGEMNPGKLDALLSAASVAMTIPRLLDELIGPLLVEIGERWHLGELRVGHEHVASSVIRRFLDNLRATASMHADGPTIVVTTPSGHSHEMGAMMAAVAAAVAGWKVIYMMPNMPSREIVATALQVKARALALSMTYPADDPQIVQELRFLRDQLPAEVAIFVGGQAASSYLPLLEQIGAVYLTGVSDIIEVLGEYRGQAKAG